MKKQVIGLVAATALSFVAMQSQADSYIGASFGSTDADTGITNATTLDEKDSGFKVFYGFEASSNVDVELHYAGFGEITATDGTIEMKRM